MPVVGFNKSFDLQVEFLRAKQQIPSDRWDAIKKSEHDGGFIVAGAAKADLLADLHEAVIRAAEEGAGLEAFRRDFEAIVAKNGWTGWTGEGSDAGRAWRTRIIYQTNMATSYAAGRYAQLTDPELLSVCPYWKYHHMDGVAHPRPQHVSWNGLVLPNDHEFWATHYPPNGWMCHCWVTAVGQGEYEAAEKAGKVEPPDGWQNINPKTGAPFGIDKGFDYAPGATKAQDLRDFVAGKLSKLPAQIGADLWGDIESVAFDDMAAAYRDWLVAIGTDETAKSLTPIVGVVDSDVLDALATADLPLPSTAEIAINSGIINGPKAIRHSSSGNAMTDLAWEQLPELLREPVAVLYDTASGKLLYVLSGINDRVPQVVVQFDYAKRGATMNMIVSGYQVFPIDLKNRIINGGLVLLLGGV